MLTILKTLRTLICLKTLTSFNKIYIFRFRNENYLHNQQSRDFKEFWDYWKPFNLSFQTSPSGEPFLFLLRLCAMDNSGKDNRSHSRNAPQETRPQQHIATKTNTSLLDCCCKRVRPRKFGSYALLRIIFPSCIARNEIHSPLQKHPLLITSNSHEMFPDYIESDKQMI